MTKQWKVKKLIDLCDVFADGDWIESKHQSSRGIRLIQTGNVGDGLFKDRAEKARYISEDTFRRLRCTEVFEGDCLISRLPDPVGRACILPDSGEKMITAVDCTIVRFKKSMLPQFFNYYSQSFNYLNDIEQETTGTTRKRISRSKLGEVNIPVPSLPEQQRIVSILDESFIAIASAKEKTEKSLRYSRDIFQAYLQNVFGNPSDGWKQKKLGEIAQHSLGKMLDRAKNRGSYKKYLRNLNVRWFEFDLSDLLEMRFRDEEQEQYTAVKGDILICEGGYPGRAAIWNEDYPIHFQKAIHRVRFHTPEYNKWFLYFLYLSHLNRDIEKYFTGAGIQHFTGEALDRFILPIAPVTEVKEITFKLDTLYVDTRKLEKVYQQKLDELEKLKKSILHKAFNGQLSGAS